jgi:AAA15 family ATPase/GTPase
MLLRFGASNHRSIREYQEINFTASSLKDSEEGLLSLDNNSDPNQLTVSSRLKVLPVIAIYGSNAAGKSTTLNALDFYVDAIIHSHNRVAKRKGTQYSPFMLDKHSRNSESSYDSDFVIEDTRYQYGFKVDGECVTCEWLYAFNLNSKRQVRTVLFHRDRTEEEEFYFGGSLKGDNKRIVKSVRDNSLYISVAAQNAHPVISDIYDYFLTKVSTRLEREVNNITISRQLNDFFSASENNRAKAFEFLRSADIGVGDLVFSPAERDEETLSLLKDVEQIFAKHFEGKNFDGFDMDHVEARLLHTGEGDELYPIDLMHESTGTLALLQLLGPVLTALTTGGMLIVDELNISLHPVVAREIVKLFSSPETNPGQAQLFFTTHDTGMLTDGVLRRDQIWFVEKSKSGATKLFPLSDIKVRATDNFEKGYIEGRFGATPIFNRNKSRIFRGSIVDANKDEK